MALFEYIYALRSRFFAPLIKIRLVISRGVAFNFQMKRWLPLVLLGVQLFLGVGAWTSFAEEPSSPPASVAPKPRNFAAFKAFFKRKGAITEAEVVEQFGPPDAHKPLYPGQHEEPPSWWYYEIENGERIDVAIQEERVIFVSRQRKNKSVDVLREWSSLNKP